MNSKELIDQANRRYAEMEGARREWDWRSWYNGYLSGWMDRYADAALAGAEPEPRFTAADMREAFVEGAKWRVRGWNMSDEPAIAEALRRWPDAGGGADG